MTVIETRLHPGQWGNGHEGNGRRTAETEPTSTIFSQATTRVPTVLEDGDDFYMTYSSFDASRPDGCGIPKTGMNVD